MDEYSRELQENVRLLATTSTTASTQASSSESSTQDVVNHEAMGEFMRGLRKLLATTQASSSRNVEEPTRESTAFQDSAIGNVKRQ